MSEPSSTYKSAGVDIAAGEQAVRSMKAHVRTTFNDLVLTDLGGFGGMMRFPGKDMADPVLVSSIDGVGTKVKIASMMERYDTVGMDIVNHCVNDILVQGAMPMFFLDYFATSKLRQEVIENVVAGMSIACREVGCVLIGGETAEMPGVYLENEFDIAGCVVGLLDRQNIIDGSKVEAGDVVVGIASSGLHTNGYSLARKVLFEDAGLKPDQYVPELGAVLGDVLLVPHRCYLNPIKILMQEHEIKAMAHITGGGFYGNIPRALPTSCQVTVERRNWGVPPIFNLIQERGNIDTLEMYRAFNMGIGMTLIVAREIGMQVAERLNELGENAWIIGEVHKGGREVTVI